MTCLQAILDGIDQNSINQALANEYASHIAANERQLAQALEFKARLYENLVTGTINKEEYTDYKSQIHKGCGKCERSDPRSERTKLSDVLENRSERKPLDFPFHAVFHDGDPGPQSCGPHDTEYQGDWEKGTGDHVHIPG